MREREEGQKSVCYANPALLLRRPISELLALQEGTRKLGLLIPSRTAEHEKALHHTTLFTEAEVLTYKAWHPPGPFEWPVPGWGFLKQARRAFKEYDVVHAWAHFYPSTHVLALLKLFHPRTKLILTMDTLPGYSFDAGWLLNAAFKLWTWTLGRLVYGAPDTITLYGEALVPHARRSGINMRKVRVIPTGILEHKLPARSTARKKVEAELKIPRGEKIVLYAGLLNPRKRVEDVLSIAVALPDVHFLIAGDGPSKKKLESMKKLRNVRFLGWRNDLLTLMRAADVLLFPSSAEGLPGVVMEAMYCETPVVTTSIPCTTDLIKDGKEGVLCEVGDVSALTNATRKMLKDQALAQRVAKRARERITRQAWKRVGKTWEGLYR